MAAAKQMTSNDRDAQIDIRLIDVGDQVLNVAIKEGPTDKPPLLMFNGIGANLELGLPLLAQLTDRRAVIFDVPGVGGSPLPNLPYRPRTLARWVKQLCEVLGYEQVDVSGVSWGGGMAQQFAHQYPKLCRKLILAATSAGFTMIPGKPNVLSKMASPRRYSDRNYMKSISAEIYGGDFRDGGDHIRLHAAGMKPQSQRGYVYQLLCMTGWTSAHWLWSLRQPTLIMAGDDDPLIPLANARLLHSLIPGSQLEVLNNGHLFLVTRPEESARMIEAFLDS
ncbi:MAG: poly(3-hydroxyalkanoate) depolymerase [Pikeienuella sp.]